MVKKNNTKAKAEPTKDETKATKPAKSAVQKNVQGDVQAPAQTHEVERNVGSTSDRIRDRLVRYLFNKSVIDQPAVTMAAIASAAGPTSNGKRVTSTQVMRWLREMKLDRASRKKDVLPMPADERGKWLTSHLTFDQIMGLYEWAKEERFDQAIASPDAKRGYRLTKPRPKRKAKQTATQRAQAAKEAKQAVAAVLNDDEPESVPAEQPKEPATLADRIRDWLADGSWSLEQAEMLAENIMANERLKNVVAGDPMSQAVFKQMTADPEFNAEQWAFDMLLDAMPKGERTQFYQLAEHRPVTSDKITKGVGVLFSGWNRHKHSITLHHGTADQAMSVPDQLAQELSRDELNQLAWHVLEHAKTPNDKQAGDLGDAHLNQGYDRLLTMPTKARLNWAFAHLYAELSADGHDAFDACLKDRESFSAQKPAQVAASTLYDTVADLDIDAVKRLRRQSQGDQDAL